MRSPILTFVSSNEQKFVEYQMLLPDALLKSKKSGSSSHRNKALCFWFMRRSNG